MKTTTRIHGWQDAAELVVLAWLFLSPFVLNFFNTMEAGLTAISIGAISSMLAQFGEAKDSAFDEWVNIALAILLVVSPWLFGYSHLAIATWNAVITGWLFGVFAVLALVRDYKLREERLREAGQH